jgi:ribonuclease HI
VTSAPPRRAYGQQDLDQFRTRLAELRLEQQPALSAAPFVAYTDGACFGNPTGPGGWAAVVEPSDLAADGLSWKLWGHLSSTSNNRAEALGMLAALEWVPTASRLTIYSDSQLSVNVFSGIWKARANIDIWDLIKQARAQKQLHVAALWVRGHAGDPGNELADRLSKLGAANAQTDTVDPVAAAGAARQKARPLPAELVGLEPVSDWERGFLSSVADLLRGGRQLSPKQQAVVDRIRARGAG